MFSEISCTDLGLQSSRDKMIFLHTESLIVAFVFWDLMYAGVAISTTLGRCAVCVMCSIVAQAHAVFDVVVDDEI